MHAQRPKVWGPAFVVAVALFAAGGLIALVPNMCASSGASSFAPDLPQVRQQPSITPICVNVGEPTRAQCAVWPTPCSRCWRRDQAYSPSRWGYVQDVPLVITPLPQCQTAMHYPSGGTMSSEEASLFRAQRIGEFDYLFDGLPAGRYEVVLGFSEVNWHDDPVRVFDVELEGTNVLHIDLDKLVGRVCTAYVTTTIVYVEDGQLNVDFERTQPPRGRPVVSAIRVAGPLTFEADLAVSKFDSPDPVAAGTVLTYTLNYTNTGACDAHSVYITDTLPTGTQYGGLVSELPAIPGPTKTADTLTWYEPSLAAGVSGHTVFTVTLNADATNPLRNKVEISGTACDGTSSYDEYIEYTMMWDHRAFLPLVLKPCTTPTATPSPSPTPKCWDLTSNGSFDYGLEGWKHRGVTIEQLGCPDPKADAPSALLDTADSELACEVTLPATIRSASLSFDYDAWPASPQAGFTVRLRDLQDSQPGDSQAWCDVAPPPDLEWNEGCKNHHLDLGKCMDWIEGRLRQTVELCFALTGNGQGVVQVYLDNVKFTVCTQ